MLIHLHLLQEQMINLMLSINNHLVLSLLLYHLSYKLQLNLNSLHKMICFASCGRLMRMNVLDGW